MTNMTRQHQAHKKSETQQYRHADPGILGFFNRVEKTEGDGHKQDEPGNRASRKEAEIELHTQPCAKNGRDHRNREKPIGITQYAVAGQNRYVGAAVSLLQVVLHIAYRFFWLFAVIECFSY